MAKDYDYPTYDAGGRIEKYKEGGDVKKDNPKKRAGYFDYSKKDPNKDLDYGGHDPGYQKYLDKQDFGKAFKLSKKRYEQFKWRGKVYSTKEK